MEEKNVYILKDSKYVYVRKVNKLYDFFDEISFNNLLKTNISLGKRQELNSYIINNIKIKPALIDVKLTSSNLESIPLYYLDKKYFINNYDSIIINLKEELPFKEKEKEVLQNIYKTYKFDLYAYLYEILSKIKKGIFVSNIKDANGLLQYLYKEQSHLIKRKDKDSILIICQYMWNHIIINQ